MGVTSPSEQHLDTAEHLPRRPFRILLAPGLAVAPELGRVPDARRWTMSPDARVTSTPSRVSTPTGRAARRHDAAVDGAHAERLDGADTGRGDPRRTRPQIPARSASRRSALPRSEGGGQRPRHRSRRRHRSFPTPNHEGRLSRTSSRPGSPGVHRPGPPGSTLRVGSPLSSPQIRSGRNRRRPARCRLPPGRPRSGPRRSRPE